MLLLQDKEATQLHTLLFVPEVSNVLSDQSQTDFERSDVISH